MKEARNKKLPKQVPLLLRRLHLVKAELKRTRFPRTAEEGLRQVAALSATSLRLLRGEVRSGLRGASDKQVEAAMRRLLARLSHADAKRTLRWKKERARCFGR